MPTNSQRIEQLAGEITRLAKTQANQFDRIVEVLEVFLRRDWSVDREDLGKALVTIPNDEWQKVARDRRIFVRQTLEGWKIGFKREDGWYQGVTAAEWNPKMLLVNPQTVMDEDGLPVEETGG